MIASDLTPLPHSGVGESDCALWAGMMCIDCIFHRTTALPALNQSVSSSHMVDQYIGFFFFCLLPSETTRPYYWSSPMALCHWQSSSKDLRRSINLHYPNSYLPCNSIGIIGVRVNNAHLCQLSLVEFSHSETLPINQFSFVFLLLICLVWVGVL